MDISARKSLLWEETADILVLPFFEGGNLIHLLEREAPSLAPRAKEMIKAHEFTGKKGQNLVLPGAGISNLLVLGLGSEKRGPVFAEVLRESAGQLVQIAERLMAKSAVIDFRDRVFTPESVQAFVTGLELGAYRFHDFKKEKKEAKLQEVMITAQDGLIARSFTKALERTRVINEAVNLARTLVNTPAKDMTPEHLAKAALEIAKSSEGKVKVKVLNREACAKKNMGAFLAVAQGAEHEPKFIHLSYISPRPTKKTLVLVGKGVTFDSGGLSLKPADAMMSMKCDMAGAATVIGFFSLLNSLQPRVNIHGLVAATENMPSGKAIRPGDIVKVSNGATVEILNTDAEGRLTLADALTYAVKLEPTAIIDFATLTGAVIVALGEEISGLMTNNKALGKNLLESAKDAGEKLWELPLEPHYRDLILSDVADYKNITGTRYGGSLTAGLFLQEFVADLPWAHLDIAGPAYAEKPITSYLAKGGTGYGIRTLVEFIEKF